MDKRQGCIQDRSGRIYILFGNSCYVRRKFAENRTVWLPFYWYGSCHSADRYDCSSVSYTHLADPTADIEGYDAGRKLAIMASIAFHSSVTFDDVYTEGISKITAKDIRYAHELGYEIKLLGLAKLTPEGIEVKVHPTMIPLQHPLAAVKDSFNAVFVHGDAVDDAMFYGRGAGALPTGCLLYTSRCV